MNKTKKHEKRHRSDLTGEHPLGDLGQVLTACLFAGTWILDTFFLHYTTFLNDSLSPAVRIPLGAAFLIFSAYLAKTGLFIVFGKPRATPGVIRKGVFNLVRHPIYLSEILFYLGLLMLSLSLASALIMIAGIFFLHYISRYEERLLLARFGQEYEQYLREVPMWLPWPRKRQA